MRYSVYWWNGWHPRGVLVVDRGILLMWQWPCILKYQLMRR